MTFQRTILLSLAAGILGCALGCSADHTLVGDELPVPAVLAAEPVSVCSAPAGSATVVLLAQESTITLNAGAQPPVDRVDLAGAVSGLQAGERVLVALVSVETACPAGRVFDIGVDADGDFTAALDISGFAEFRLVALVTDGTPASIACDDTADCLTTADAAVILASSNALLVRVE